MKLKFKKRAFTLAEVLLALGIIGVIAALTLPVVHSRYKESVYIAQLKKTFSTFSQAYTASIAEFGPITEWSAGCTSIRECSLSVYQNITANLKVATDCRNNQKCFAEEGHRNLNKQRAYAARLDGDKNAIRGILHDGTPFLIKSYSKNCAYNLGDPPYHRSCGIILVDTNGNQGPNMAGVDLFSFIMTPMGLYPSGLRGYNDRTEKTECAFGSDSKYNGEACSGWVLQRGNMNYTTQTVSWDN